MSSAHHHPHHHHRPEQQHSAMLPHQPPPPVVPLEQLPSASIVQLPPAYHVPKAVPPTVVAPPPPPASTVAYAASLHVSDSTATYALPSWEQLPNPNKRPFEATFQTAPSASVLSAPQSASLNETMPIFSSQSLHYHEPQSLYSNLDPAMSMYGSNSTSNPAVGNNNTTTSTSNPAVNNNNNSNNNSSNPATSSSNSNTNLSEKKLRRLEKNRLSARECRRRKREATEDMEQEIFRLEAENLKLRLQLRIGEEAEESIGREQERVTEEIEDLLKNGASEGELYATIEDFKEKFADYGRDRRSAIEFHLHNVERLLQPTQTTSVAMRALEGGTKLMEGGGINPSSSVDTAIGYSATTVATADTGDVAIASSANERASLSEPKNLFSFLVNYLQVTPEQAAVLKDSRWVARELDDCLKSSMDVLEELRQRLRLCGNGLETEFDNVRSVLTPTQAAKFLVWVANNRACIHMLNELWSRVYPDPCSIDGEDDDKKPEAKGGTPESPLA